MQVIICQTTTIISKLVISHFLFSDSSGSPGTSFRMDSQDSTEVEWGSSRQPSISLKEWDIPIEDLKIGPKIGSGQFSTGTLDQRFTQAVNYISLYTALAIF